MANHPATRLTQGHTPRQPATWTFPADAGFRDAGAAVLWAVLILAPMLGLGGWVLHGQWKSREEARRAAIQATMAYERLIASEPAAMLPVEELVHGREVFNATCVACHGPTGRGVPGLGKDLVESDFIAIRNDEQILDFLVSGRPEARPVAMPPRGGRDDLTDQQLALLVHYLRALQDPRRMPELPEVVVAAGPSEEQVAAALQAAGGDSELAEYIASGNRIFHTACVACHGRAGVGVPGNGKALANNTFIQSLDDDALLGFIAKGRAPSDPANTTGIQMPPKGGNPALSEDDLLDVVAYLRTLQPPSAAPSRKD